MMLEDVISDIFFQKTLSNSFAADRPPKAKPSASRTALTEPALVAVIPSKVRRSSSSRRSSTPQVKALWLPPPWSAKLIVFCPASGALAASSTDLGCAVMALPYALAERTGSADEGKGDTIADYQLI